MRTGDYATNLAACATSWPAHGARSAPYDASDTEPVREKDHRDRVACRDDGLRGPMPLHRRQALECELPDPAGRPIDEVRATREQISRRVETL